MSCHMAVGCSAFVLGYGAEDAGVAPDDDPVERSTHWKTKQHIFGRHNLTTPYIPFNVVMPGGGGAHTFSGHLR